MWLTYLRALINQYPMPSVLRSLSSYDIYFNTPRHYLQDLQCSWLVDRLKAMDITWLIGEQAPFLDNNYQLRSILSAKGIVHRLQHWHDSGS